MMNLLKLKKLANAGQFDELAELWPEIVTDPEAERDMLLRIVGQVRRLGAPEQSDKLLAAVLHQRQEKNGKADRLETCRMAAEYLPESELLRRELRNLYNEVHGDYDQTSALTGRLIGDHQKLGQAVDRMERFLALKPGGFFSDRSHLEPGMVESVDGENGVLSVTFAGRSETLDIEAVDDVIILPADHFPSMLRYRPDELRALADDDPEAFVTQALQSTRDRQCSYKDLRKHVTQLKEESGWAGWWKKARPILRTSHRLELKGVSQPTFRLLRRERSYEDRIRETFQRLKEPVEILDCVLDYIDELGKKRAADSELLVEMGNKAARQAGPLLKTDPSMTLACMAVHARVAEMGAPVVKLNPKAAAGVLGKIKEPNQLPAHLGDRLLNVVLSFVRSSVPDGWADFWSEVMPRCGRMMSDMIARELLAADRHESLGRALVRVLDHPTASPAVACWLWRARHADTKQAAVLRELPGIDTARCLDAMLKLVDATGRMSAVSDDKRLRTVLDQAVETLTLYDSKPIQDLVSDMDVTAARDLKNQLDSSDGLRASLRASVTAMLRNAYPEIYVEAARPWEEDVFYTTEAGLQRRQNELEELVSVELPAVAKQIGEAASHGDLSENAEYTAALEKRDQITSNATRIEGELVKAKVIEPEMTTTDFVNVGTRVTARDLETGKDETYAFLGVWDSDPDNHVLSYRAPLAMAFMGRKVSDQVEYGEEGDKRRWEILEVGPAL
jgi:transcription elongation factor GreA